MKNTFFLLIASAITLVFGQTEPPVISISDGQLRGTSNKTIGQNITYFAYKGIPYAKTPINDLRFAAPVKNDPWTGILNATEDKDECTQIPAGIAIPGSEAAVLGSEDCLYINVYTTNVTGNLPVMVWFYGGTFFSGSSKYKLYAPDYLLEKNVVFVSFNYRLGVFGFLSTEDLEAPGNWGLKDQILALKWVKDNIEKFGGDPTRVTIFGESAGAASVSYLTHSPLAQGLFSGIIAQSGSSLCLWSLSHNARMKAFNVGIQMGFISLSSKALIKFLRSVDYKKLKLAESNVTLQAFLGGNILAGLPFAVVKEPNHPGAVFSSRTWQQLESGNFSRVPMIVGFNSNEGAALSSYIDLIRPVMVQYDLDLTRLVPHDLTRNPLKRIPAAFEVRRNFFNLSPIALQDQSLGRYITVDQFERPIREFVIQTSKYTKVFYYQFSYKGILGDPNNAQQGVGHAEELNYLFVKDRNATANDLRTVDRFTTLWTNFAKNGNPTPLSSSNTSLGLLNWESNDPNTNATASIKYLNIDLNINMSVNPFQDDWIFYQKLYATYGDPPYATY